MAMNAKNADRHELYERSVQHPELVIDLIEHRYKGRPLVLREDFCGTAQLASMWVASDPKRRAVGVDLDKRVLAWADRHNRKPLGEAADRLELVRSDVMKHAGRADVVVSLNFSHFIYKTRKDLVAYLRHARRCVKPGGLFVCDLYGGPGALAPCRDERDFGSFSYEWEQVSYDVHTARVLNHIHFKFPNRSRLDRAFTYDWRLWTMAELREALLEVGFTKIEAWFEGDEGFERDLDTADYDAWVAYLIARR
jgi:SAM-dependent methyltransferase